MSIKPILFNGDMVRAILDGRKTVTRRVLAEKVMLDKKWGLDREPYLRKGKWYYDEQTAVDDSRTIELKPKYQPGDILYVRETQSIHRINNMGDKFVWVNYKADGSSQSFKVSEKEWKRLAKYDYTDECYISPYWTTYETCRIWLKVTNVRVERLQDITEEQAVKEGCFTFQDKTGNGKFNDVIEFDLTARDAFVELWNGTLKKDSACTWAHNPWVWVIEFERCEKPEEVEK